MLVFLFTTLLFLLILAFAVRPYYRYNMDFGAPPLAIRTGLMAFACIPILVALAGKANLVTLLTGISHEKLNVVHRWVAWMSFGLSLVHTIPFFVASYHDGGYAEVREEFYVDAMRGSNEYSGAPPLAILLGLCIFSLQPIRNRFYESFYLVHILLAITYVGLLFWHANNQLDSWVYLWATIALWLASYFARIFWYTRQLNVRNRWLVGAPASFLQLPGDMTRIEVISPRGFRHTPAQHCFLRFPAISLLDNHPFTIASVQRTVDPPKTKAATDVDNPQAITFLVRTHAGFTHKLATYCASHPDTDALAWIDGPYGGITRPVECLYDTLILVAGGGGISACVPWLLYVMGKSRGSAGSLVKIKRVVLVWAMRKAEHFAWAEKELDEVAADGQSEVVIQVAPRLQIE
ncbi:hypothetical protein K440DRAFT_14090 [Wilcoxina mikolae CBS 423.85]|nr:hypothetical protein K440DRAFT_14090 [Wilcoxina mikolae CBS 423.85]